MFKKEGPKLLGYYKAKTKVFRGCIRVHLDHKNLTFDKMHQGSQVDPFEIPSEVESFL